MKERFAVGGRLIWLIPLVAAAVLTLSYARPGASSAYPGSAATGFQTASAQETDYDWPVWEGSQNYTNHIDEHFKLYIREEKDRLRVHLPSIPDVTGFAIAQNRLVYEVSLKKFEYNTVARPADCSLELFFDNYDHVLKYQPGAQNYLPLRSSDYGRYYCFRVTLDVDRRFRANPQPKRVFIAQKPIAAANISNDLDQFPGFSQSVMQNTYYDYNPGLFTDSEQLRPRYYAHLGNHFNLYYKRLANGRFEFRLRTPAGLTVPSGRDIRPFTLERFNYTIVDRSADCGRPAFEATTNLRNPHPSMSLAPASGDAGRYYCLKVSIKSAIPGRGDPQPYRIFFIPEEIIAPENIPTTATNRHRARLSN